MVTKELSSETIESASSTSPLWQMPGWYHAVTLTERIASLSTAGSAKPLSAREKIEQAEKKIQRWKEQFPFNKDSFFTDRLAMDAITEQELLALLAEPIEDVHARTSVPTPPDWLLKLSAAFDTYAISSDKSFLQQEIDQGHDVHAFLLPFSPLLQSGVERLRAGIEALVEQYHVLPFDPKEILSLLLPNVAQQIIAKVNRTIVFELNIARLKGLLQGETAQERFQSYLQFLCRRENLLSFLEEYCVLAMNEACLCQSNKTGWTYEELQRHQRRESIPIVV